MSRVDITKAVVAMHEDETLKKLIEETNLELSKGVPTAINEEVSALLVKAKAKKSNVVRFNSKNEPANQAHFAAETELLAAAGQSLGEWFSQPINFAGIGLILDIRRILNTENEVDLYLTPSDPKAMSDALSDFKGKCVELSITNGEKSILAAELYIDESGEAAEGSGVLVNVESATSVKGKISIDIQVQE